MNGPLMLDLESEKLTPEEISLLEDERVGGIILFSRNFSSAYQVNKLCNSIHNIREEIIIAVDQEGGRVQRFKNDFTTLPPVGSLSKIANALGLDLLELSRKIAWLMAAEVRSVGVDISFAPVLDIDNGKSEIIGDRGFDSDPSIVTKIAKAYIEGMKDAGMAACGKHFPGHGSVVADSHLELPIDIRAIDEIMFDIQPFRELSPVLQGMMPAHIIYTEIDSVNPAGFSSIWIQEILRKQLQFNGVVFSDDLSMEGAASFGGYCQRASKAIEAGCDMVLICNNRSAVNEVLASDVLNINHLSSAKTSSERIEQLKSNNRYSDMDSLKQDIRWQEATNILKIYKESMKN